MLVTKQITLTLQNASSTYTPAAFDTSFPTFFATGPNTAPQVESLATSPQFTDPLFMRSSVILPNASPMTGILAAPPTTLPDNPTLIFWINKA